MWEIEKKSVNRNVFLQLRNKYVDNTSELSGYYPSRSKGKGNNSTSLELNIYISAWGIPYIIHNIMKKTIFFDNLNLPRIDIFDIYP